MGISAPTAGLTIVGNYIAKTTLSELPTASNYPTGTKAYVTDIGVNGTEYVVTNSGAWAPVNGSALIDKLYGVPLVKAPTFTGTTNGTIVFGTAVNTVFAKCFTYFDANTLVASHAAGFYYTEMSDTTNAVVYNNTYTPAVGVYPTEPTSKTAFAGAVPGGAGVTSQVTAFKYRTVANSLGRWGASKLFAHVECNNTAGVKMLRMSIAGTTVHSQSVTSSSGLYAEGYMRNRGATNAQRASGGFTNTTNSGAIAPSLAFDTTADIEHSCTLQTSGAATDWMALSYVAAYLEA